MRQTRWNRAAIAAVVVCAACLAAWPVAAQQAEAAPTIDVDRAVVATAVEDREPIGVAETFPATVGELVFYTTLSGDFGPTTVEHVWLREGEEKARVSLDVTGPRFRTWSTKKIPAEWAGAWTVRLLDPAGNELTSVDFTVGGD